MAHSYEEIRGVVLDILAKREQIAYEPNQYNNIENGVAEVFFRREVGNHKALEEMRSGRKPYLADADADLFLEVFWDLFRQGIITLGLNSSSREFPFCRVSRMGRRIIENQGVYFFHDVTTYERLIIQEIPTIDKVTLLYLKEAMQAFRSGCILSATVMIGVATEHTFLLLLDIIETSPAYSQTFKNIFAERTILQKINKFKNILDQQSKMLPPELKEDLDTHFAGILSMIRTFRNQSGHPSGIIVEREQAYILLQLFIPYCKKMYALMNYFKP